MATSNKRIVEIHDVDEQASGPGGDGAKPVSVFGWMGTAVKGAGSACFHMLTGPAAGPLILACVCAALAYGTKRPRKLPVLHRSMSIAALHGGEVALERILDAQEARVNEAALKSAADRMRELLAADPKTISYRELHRVAAKLEMSGREDEAIEMLQKAVEEAEKKKQPHEAHELQMVLVEMLIYKGEYQRALQCKCLQWKCQKDEENSDARGPLYMVTSVPKSATSVFGTFAAASIGPTLSRRDHHFMTSWLISINL
uniref:Uncharacterized protein LOC105040634 isoform X2 n=1 Tax=Elaeis guineensis var. tenera TaxID=51953 RepID=A0A6J0PFM0_ELAGV|nr:uncharacterized protein LOC105040634 isoform X2 [Elaeis guineensis]